jgi:predicted transcriptional regulator
MKLKIETIRRKVRYTIRDIAEITGLMVSYSVAVPLEILHTKLLEIDKIKALKESKGICSFINIALTFFERTSQQKKVIYVINRNMTFRS